MATFGEFLRKKRKELGMNQSQFGQNFDIIMTDISKIENGHKKFPFESLEKLAEFLKMEYSNVKNLYVADKLVDEAHKYDCPDIVFSLAESQSKYIKNKNAKQGKLAI
ncbi:helix-turn-helix transcriptional regulator [Tamlana crocina]